MNAFVFPGQGSQSVGMLVELADRHSLFAEHYRIASQQLGFDLEALIYSDEHKQLDITEFTQPAILTCSVTLWQLWLEKGGRQPDFVAGHSLGEYSAAVVAGVFSFEDAVKLVHQRGKIMQQAITDGIMVALVGLDDNKVIKLCTKISEEQSDAEYSIVEAANFNAPGQVVVAGRKQKLEAIIKLAKQAGAKRAIPLPVSVPSHCSLMKEASQRFSEHLNNVTIKDATIPLVQNVDAQARTEAEQIKERLVKQLYKPVNWRQSIEFLASQGVTQVYECGPGKVLLSLIKRIDRRLVTTALSEPSSFM